MHPVTNKYLALDSDRVEMVLREDALQSANCLFCIRSISQEQTLDLEEDLEEGSEDGPPITHNTEIFLQSYYKSFI